MPFHPHHSHRIPAAEALDRLTASSQPAPPRPRANPRPRASEPTRAPQALTPPPPTR